MPTTTANAGSPMAQFPHFLTVSTAKETRQKVQDLLLPGNSPPNPVAEDLDPS